MPDQPATPPPPAKAIVELFIAMNERGDATVSLDIDDAARQLRTGYRGNLCRIVKRTKLQITESAATALPRYVDGTGGSCPRESGGPAPAPLPTPPSGAGAGFSSNQGAHPMKTAAKPKPPPISTITAADGLALADRLAMAGTTRSAPDRSDLRLAAAVIRSLVVNAQPFDRFTLYGEDDEP